MTHRNLEAPISSNGTMSRHFRGIASSSYVTDEERDQDLKEVSHNRRLVATAEKVFNGNCLSASGGERLNREEFMIDSTNRYGVMYTITGDLCTFSTDPTSVTDQISWVWTWCLGIGNLYNSHAYVDNDGYLRLVTISGQTYWKSQNSAGAGGMFIMKPNGNLVLMDSSKTTKWACGTPSAGYISLPDFSTAFPAYISSLCPLDTAVTVDDNSLVCRVGTVAPLSSAVSFKVNFVAVIVVSTVCVFVIFSTLVFSLWTWILKKRKEKYDAQQAIQPYKSFRRSSSMVIRTGKPDIQRRIQTSLNPSGNGPQTLPAFPQHRLFHPIEEPVKSNISNPSHDHAKSDEGNHSKPQLTMHTVPPLAMPAQTKSPKHVASVTTVVPIETHDSPSSSDDYPLEHTALTQSAPNQNKHHHHHDTHHHHLHDATYPSNNSHSHISNSSSSQISQTDSAVARSSPSPPQTNQPAVSGTTIPLLSLGNNNKKIAPTPSKVISTAESDSSFSRNGNTSNAMMTAAMAVSGLGPHNNNESRSGNNSGTSTPPRPASRGYQLLHGNSGSPGNSANMASTVVGNSSSTSIQRLRNAE
jgi:hypothetical protein